ncbi:unnamed protein product [Danaus chrysippus]|uniref:(African queen) hypothetical protein n=1 Tax=Danaus chrysippus TaxID=151541 RepID=A0A8J2R1Z0_9NEOP|nr:unnamed protein product [Danaus chrysippus]
MRGPYRVVKALLNGRYELKLLSGSYGETTQTAARYMVPWRGDGVPSHVQPSLRARLALAFSVKTSGSKALASISLINRFADENNSEDESPDRALSSGIGPSMPSFNVTSELGAVSVPAALYYWSQRFSTTARGQSFDTVAGRRR